MHLVCGEALFDLFVEDADGGRGGGQIAMKAIAGGSPFNVAIGMARLGAQVGFASDIAKDFLGERIVAQLVKEGVAPSFWRRTAAATALAIVAADPLGAPTYSFSGLEQAFYCPSSEAIERAEDSISGVHVGSIATVLPNSARPLHELVVRFADRALVSLDPNVRLAVVPDRGFWRRAIENLRPFCQVVKVSDEDMAALYGDVDPAAVCRSWLTDRTALVILTRGGKGASMFSRAAGEVAIAPAAAIVADTVGAGDSFMAAVLSRLTSEGSTSFEAIATMDPRQLLALGSFAARAAGLTCSRRGPELPYAAELEPLETVTLNG